MCNILVIFCILNPDKYDTLCCILHLQIPQNIKIPTQLFFTSEMSHLLKMLHSLITIYYTPPFLVMTQGLLAVNCPKTCSVFFAPYG